MELAGTKVIAADIATVWAHLNNPDTLKACIPGCEVLTGTPETGFAATVKQKVGPVKATFHGEVTLENVVENQSYTIVGEGKGGRGRPGLGHAGQVNGSHRFGVQAPGRYHFHSGIVRHGP